MSVNRYRKKPVVIEAVQWDGTAAGATPIINWILSGDSTARYSCDDPTCQDHRLAIDTLEGTMHASPWDWIIRGVSGEFYPCKPGIFAATYEAADQ